MDRVKTPVLVLLGEDDLRVPPTQGRGYYHVLKGKGRVVEMLVFPKETRPIDGVEVARVSFEAGWDWFRAFTPTLSQLDIRSFVGLLGTGPTAIILLRSSIFRCIHKLLIHPSQPQSRAWIP